MSKPQSRKWPGRHHRLAAIACFLVFALPLAPAAARGAAAQGDTLGLERLLGRAVREGWDSLAVGDAVARFALALEGAPYAEGTLEGPGPEVCRVRMAGFDCVTLVETSLNLARTTGASRGRTPSAEDVFTAVTYTRYRAGRLAGYISRLHYTSEWIADNVAKGVVEDVTRALGGDSCGYRVGYMSAHPDRYPALIGRPDLVDSMRVIEARINQMPRTCIPLARVAAIEPRLRTGDIIAIATSIEGLDYSHTGLIYRDAEGVARFLHASSTHGRVILDARLSDYLAGGPKSTTGISVLRPLPPSAGK